MKNKDKVIPVIVAAVLIVLSVVLPILMKDKPQKYEYVISPATPEAFETLFGEQYGKKDEYYATVDYSFTQDGNDADSAHVNTEIDILVDKDLTCYAVAEGTVQAFRLSDDVYWTGALSGQLVIGDKVYDNAYVHFSKLENGDDFVISVSVNGESFFFGDLIIEPNKHGELVSKYNFPN